MPDILGILFLLNGGILLFWLPRYQRKVECGKAQIDPSMPSFKVLRRVAIGLVVFGVLSIIAGYFRLYDS